MGIVGVWEALLVARIVVVSRTPDADLTVFGIAEVVVIALGVGVVLAGHPPHAGAPPAP